MVVDCTVNELRTASGAGARHDVRADTQESFGQERVVMTRNSQPATNLKATPLMQ